MDYQSQVVMERLESALQHRIAELAGEGRLYRRSAATGKPPPLLPEIE